MAEGSATHEGFGRKTGRHLDHGLPLTARGVKETRVRVAGPRGAASIDEQGSESVDRARFERGGVDVAATWRHGPFTDRVPEKIAVSPGKDSYERGDVALPESSGPKRSGRPSR